jgi:hypothetical protein
VTDPTTLSPTADEIRALRERVRELETENKKLTDAISAFQKAWSEEDDQAVNDAFDALGDAKHPSVLRDLGLPPEASS